MADNLSTSLAEVSFDVESGAIESCWVAGEDGSQYRGRTMDEFLQSESFKGLSDQPRSQIQEALLAHDLPKTAEGSGAGRPLTVKLVNPEAIDRKYSFVVRWVGGGRKTGLLSVTDVTAERLAEGFFDHLGSSVLLLVGIVDAASGYCTVCEPGDLRDSLAHWYDKPYAERVDEILDGAPEGEKGDLRRDASLDKVRSRLDGSGSYSLCFGCRDAKGLSYRQMRWSYLDRDDETLAMTVADVTELYSQLERARYREEHDPLTRAFNRRGGTRRAVEEYKRVLDGAVCSMVMFDINKFKEFNDTYGHEVGDKVLTQFCDCMEERGVNGGDYVLFRYGGDEFSMLVPGAGSDDASRSRLEGDILGAAENLTAYVGGDGGKKEIKVHLSAGIDWLSADDLEGIEDLGELEGIEDVEDIGDIEDDEKTEGAADNKPLLAVKKAIRAAKDRADKKLYRAKELTEEAKRRGGSDCSRVVSEL